MLPSHSCLCCDIGYHYVAQPDHSISRAHVNESVHCANDRLPLQSTVLSISEHWKRSINLEHLVDQNYTKQAKCDDYYNKYDLDVSAATLIVDTQVAIVGLTFGFKTFIFQWICLLLFIPTSRLRLSIAFSILIPTGHYYWKFWLSLQRQHFFWEYLAHITSHLI